MRLKLVQDLARKLETKPNQTAVSENNPKTRTYEFRSQNR